MRLIKDVENIPLEDRSEALRIINKLKMGNRVFGNVSEGLKQTLKKLEDEHEIQVKSKNVLDFLDNDGDFKSQRAKLKAGINGEETLAEYFEQIIKHDKELQDIILFASLSDPDQNSGGEEYISDSDFIALYGNNILILDAKNIPTNPEIPIYLDGDKLVSVGGVTILELHPAIYVWRNIMKKNQCRYLSIHGCTVIVNKTGACIWKNQIWHSSEVKPIHISELVDFLHKWIENKSSDINLSLLTTLAKMQIKKEESSLDLRNAMKRFGI